MYDLGPSTLSPVRGMTGEVLHYIQFLNLNPPHFHLILLPLAPLPARWARWSSGAWRACSAWRSRSASSRASPVSRSRPGGAGSQLLALLGFAGMGAVAVTGQVSFLLLLPVTLALDSRAGGELGRGRRSIWAWP